MPKKLKINHPRQLDPVKARFLVAYGRALGLSTSDRENIRGKLWVGDPDEPGGKVIASSEKPICPDLGSINWILLFRNVRHYDGALTLQVYVRRRDADAPDPSVRTDEVDVTLDPTEPIEIWYPEENTSVNYEFAAYGSKSSNSLVVSGEMTRGTTDEVKGDHINTGDPTTWMLWFSHNNKPTGRGWTLNVRMGTEPNVESDSHPNIEVVMSSGG